MDTAPLFMYTLDDYPFVHVLEGQKRDHSESASNRRTLADLRNEMNVIHGITPNVLSVATFQAPNVGDPIKQNLSVKGDDSAYKKLSIPSGIYIPTIEKKSNIQGVALTSQGLAHGLDFSEPDQRSVGVSAASQPFKLLDPEQSKAVEVFEQELDNLINETSSKRDPRRDEDLITLLTLKQFVHRYFSDRILGGDALSKMMRSKINIQEMILVLSSIKFKDKNADMILVTVKQFDDIFLELLINPAGFKTSQINFYRGGKGIINVFIFLIMNVFQQVRNMKCIFAEDQSTLGTISAGQLIPSDQQMTLLKALIDASLELCLTEQSGMPVQTANNNSAFQLHSQKHSAELDKLELADPEGLIISGTLLDKNCRFRMTKVFNTSLMMRSNNMSKSKREQYSFELNRGRLMSSRFLRIRQNKSFQR